MRSGLAFDSCSTKESLMFQTAVGKGRGLSGQSEAILSDALWIQLTIFIR